MMIATLMAVAAMTAQPVWPEGKENELNSHYRFVADIVRSDVAPVLRVVAPYQYKAYLNGKFVGFGPARAAKGYYRPDEWTLGEATNGINRVEIEECCYNQGQCFENADNAAFIMAEVSDSKKLLARTGKDFKAYTVPRVRKVSRFSYQRTFGEFWKIGAFVPEEVALKVQNVEIKLLPKRSETPEFKIHGPFNVVKKYRATLNRAMKTKTIDFIEGNVNGQAKYYKGAKLFAKDELEVNLWDDCQRLVAREDGEAEATVFDSGVVGAGFLKFKIKSEGACRIYAVFDEMLSEDKDVDPTRLSVANAIRWDLAKAGEYELESFQPYELRAVRFVVFDAKAKISGVEIRELKSPAARRKFNCDDKELCRIFEAARETFAENAVDVFTDCPSRERAGWLCDSWFTARVAHFFTGSTALEKQFLENYLYSNGYGPQPKGMFPYCYPAAVTNGNYIPNWAFWLVLEIGEYLERSGDRELVDAFRPRLEELMEFFKGYENDDGLLEKLPAWVFVEWSHANKLVQDVNYPSNMTYARVLEVMADLYGKTEYRAKAAKIRKEIERQSWNGEWYCDNAVRQKDGSLKVTGEVTEVCQYYAFFFGQATAKTHAELWKRMVNDFGPEREKTGKWPKVWPANAFVGDYMRLELLSLAGMGEKVIEDIRGYFLKMADATGTLWEYDKPRASCCHGFASYVAVLLDRHAPKKKLMEFPEVSEARAITHGPKEHFFASYFAINSWSDDNRYVLALETDFNGRLPEPFERCTIGVVDLEDDNKFIPVSTTACWNFQEAAMGHWLDNDTILFNDIREGKFVTVVMNWRTKKEVRILPRPVSAVSADRKWAVSINYARLYLTRPDYGYGGDGQDALANVEWPENDGLWTMDLITGESKLILSVAQGREFMPATEVFKNKPGNPLAYYCHTVISKDGKKIFFLARSVDWYNKVTHTASKWHTTSFTVNSDGTELRRCFPDDWTGSHFNWAPDGSHRMLVTTKTFEKRSYPALVEFDIGSEPRRIEHGSGILDMDWHCVYSPNCEFMSGESYPNANHDRCWHIMRIADGAALPIGSFRVPPAYYGTYWRCDMHARWRNDGKQIGVNSVHEGSRQIYIRDVKWH